MSNLYLEGGIKYQINQFNWNVNQLVIIVIRDWAIIIASLLTWTRIMITSHVSYMQHVYVFLSIRIDKAKVTLAIESNYNLKLNLFMRLSWWLWPVQTKFSGRFSENHPSRALVLLVFVRIKLKKIPIFIEDISVERKIQRKKTQKNCENRWRKNGTNKSCLRAKANIVTAITNFLWACVCVYVGLFAVTNKKGHTRFCYFMRFQMISLFFFCSQAFTLWRLTVNSKCLRAEQWKSLNTLLAHVSNSNLSN